MHEIRFEAFPYKMGKKEIFADVNETARQRVDNPYHGLDKPIEWHEEKTFSCQEDAENELKRLAEGRFYPQLAVLYHPIKGRVVIPTAKMSKVKAQLDETGRRYAELHRKYHFADAKSARVTCQHCKSSITTSYMQKRNDCPVCGNDMRSATIVEREKKLREKCDKLHAELDTLFKEAERKQADKSQKMWLVRYEYHS